MSMILISVSIIFYFGIYVNEETDLLFSVPAIFMSEYRVEFILSLANTFLCLLENMFFLVFSGIICKYWCYLFPNYLEEFFSKVMWTCVFACVYEHVHIETFNSKPFSFQFPLSALVAYVFWGMFNFIQTVNSIFIK